MSDASDARELAGQEREDDLRVELRDLRDRGSRNFQSYRRRATIAFAVLVLATTAEGFWIYRTGRTSQDNLKTATVAAQYQSCVSGNKVRAGILLYLAKLTEKAPPAQRKKAAPAIAQAKLIFGPRDCTRAVEPIVRAT